MEFFFKTLAKYQNCTQVMKTHPYRKFEIKTDCENLNQHITDYYCA